MSDSRPPTLGQDLYSLARKECRAAQRALANARRPHESVHVARKAIRRLRAVLSLAGERFGEIESADQALRRLGRGLSRLRDAHVIVCAARALAGNSDHAAWAPAVECLERRRARILAEAMASDPEFARRRARLQQVIDRLAPLRWETLTAADVHKTLQRSAKRAAKAQRRARLDPSAQVVHAWRRRARRLRMQLEAVSQLRVQSAKSAKHGLDKLASDNQVKRLKALADQLGRFQDLQLLQRVLRGLRVLRDQPVLKAQLQREIAAASP